LLRVTAAPREELDAERLALGAAVADCVLAVPLISALCRETAAFRSPAADGPAESGISRSNVAA
jgi:hypothetical protein